MNELTIADKAISLLNRARACEPALDDVLGHFEQESGAIFLFGGAARDAVLFGLNATPRDLDIVIDGLSVETIASILKDSGTKFRLNQFGGFKAAFRTSVVDLWTLDSTWAFAAKKISGCSSELLQHTVFLNIDSIVIDIRAHRAMASVFLEALRKKTIDILLEPNPLPALNIIRALDLSERLGFQLSRRLINYINQWFFSHRDPLMELHRTLRYHYGVNKSWERVAAQIACLNGKNNSFQPLPTS